MSDEQRIEAYLNIISQLLSCQQGDENRILQDSKELLNRELIEIMVAVAKQYEETGGKNEAQWLMNTSQLLAAKLEVLENNTSEKVIPYQDYVNFLEAGLQKIYEDPSPQLIYPFLAQNVDKLDDNLIKILDHQVRSTLSSVAIEDIEQTRYLTGAIFNFSNRIREFSLGNIATNLEIAITGYQIALTIFTFDTFPQDWALTQNNLGVAYFFRIKGDEAENLEMAIAAYTEALKVRTFDVFPQEWADTQNNLASTYIKRIEGDEAENLEMAIATYTEVLKVRTFDALPQQWADTQNNLGIAYRTRIRGDRAVNLEIAISAYTEALKVRTFDTFPKDWADIQNNLGLAYQDRIIGDKAENLERAIAFYQNALAVRTFDAFPKDWADTNNNLARTYVHRIREDQSESLEKAENLEQAIIAYTETLKVYTFDTFPEKWAATQNILALAYFERIKGNKAENLETAISCGQEALKVFTFEAFPKKWADTNNNLSGAYRERIRGNIAENLETAISCGQEALKVFTFEAFPEKWADTNNNLCDAYRNRISEDIAENLKMAIFFGQEALKVFTFDAFPKDWANTQNILGDAYQETIRGDKAENLEMAIVAHQEALKAFTFDAFPKGWAAIQDNLGIDYQRRMRGDKAENLEMAITAHQEALKVFTFDAFPEECGMTLFNIGNTYLMRVEGNEDENVEAAIKAYTEALKIRTFDAFPLKWAMTQHSLGNAYLRRISGNKAKNLEQAITAYTEASRVYTFNDFPRRWAFIQNNLALVYSSRIKGNKAKNLEQAIKYCHNALEILTKDNDPLGCFLTAQNLGTIHYKENQWEAVTEAYCLAIEALENFRLEALNPQSRQEIFSNAIDAFHSIVQSHLNLKQPDQALEYVERSKARNLVELLTQKNLKPRGVDLATSDQWDKLRQIVVNEQIRIQSQSINLNLNRSNRLIPYVNDQTHLKKYQQELDDFIEQKITLIDPTFKLTQKVEPISFEEIRALIDHETCLLQWYITSEKILAFIVSSDGNIQYWQSSATDLQTLTETLNDYLRLYYSEKGKHEWIEHLPNLLQTFADTIHIHDILSLIPAACKRLIIIPHRYLHILPIHALPISNSLVFNGNREGTELHDLFSKGVQYAPSCQLLQIAKTFHHSEFNKLFAIQNPTSDLLYTELEVNTLANFFTESKIIAKDNATKDTVTSYLKSSDYHCYHFSCHGGFNPNNPLESALFVANKEPLSLSEIFELNFKKSRLVVLSACETGLIDLQSLSDEYIGLPSGFIFAGSRNVVSSLWTVSELSTSFLMIKFYEILFDKTQQVSVAIALKEAQDWLQNLTIERLDNFLEQHKPKLEKMLTQLRKGKRQYFVESLEIAKKRQPYPFANPYYWAAFIATGA